MEDTPQQQAVPPSPLKKRRNRIVWVLVCAAIIILGTITFAFTTREDILFSTIVSNGLGLSQLDCRLRDGVWQNAGNITMCFMKSSLAGQECTHDIDCNGGGCIPSAYYFGTQRPPQPSADPQLWSGIPSFNPQGELLGRCSDLDYSNWPDSKKREVDWCTYPITTIDRTACIIF